MEYQTLIILLIKLKINNIRMVSVFIQNTCVYFNLCELFYRRDESRKKLFFEDGTRRVKL